MNRYIYLGTSFSVGGGKLFQKQYELDRYFNATVRWDAANFAIDYFIITRVSSMASYEKDKRLNRSFIEKVDSKQ